MSIVSKIKYFFTNTLNLFVLAISGILTINTILFLASQGAIFSSFKNSISHGAFYAAYFAITAFAMIFFYFDKEKIRGNSLLGKILLLYFPTEAIFIYGLQIMPKIAPYVGIMSALYILALAIFIIIKNLPKENSVETEKRITSNNLDKIFITLIILFIMTINFSFGFYRLGKMAIVDEPLWTFDRIPNFWRDIKEKDWRNTNVSDKPGLTVAAISGIGLFSEPYPKQYKKVAWMEEIFNVNAGKMADFNFAFRFPILLFCVLILPLFYFFINKLAGRTEAVFSTIFIGLSPIILGNSRIINPDSILWIFTSFSILWYLIYLKNNKKVSLYWCAFFLGLSVLTKYTANILYLFFFGLIFAEYIFRNSHYAAQTVREYFKQRFVDFAIIVSLSFSIIYVLYPAIWGKPIRIFLVTIYSQAFEPIWPIFATLIILIAADFLLLKNYILGHIVKFFVKLRKPIMIATAAIFLLAILGVFLNVYTGMNYYDFEDILASPKSSFHGNDTLGFFLTNFYPLVFGVSAIALVSIIIFLTASFQKNKFSENNILAVYYLLLFIIIYYVGSVASQVASIIRYQIIIFPIFFIAAGIALGEIIKKVIPENKPQFKKIFYASSFVIIAISSYSIYQVRPFYMGYATFLLPEKYYLDVKDMGEGSYEAAEYLNSLPDAGNLSIWTDKRGICPFFIGKCYSSLSPDLFSKNIIDYFVVSSGRESRTTKMSSRIRIGEKTMQDVYNASSPEKIIGIAGRASNFVKIVASDKIK